jgi:hypothetical protein
LNVGAVIEAAPYFDVDDFPGLHSRPHRGRDDDGTSRNVSFLKPFMSLIFSPS